MSRFLEHLSNACKTSLYGNKATFFLRYVTHGDQAALAQAKQHAGPHNYLFFGLEDVSRISGCSLRISPTKKKRAMQATVYLDRGNFLASWLKSHLAKEPSDGEAYVAAYLAAFGSGKTARVQAAAILIAEQDEGWLNGTTVGPTPPARSSCHSRTRNWPKSARTPSGIAAHCSFCYDTRRFACRLCCTTF